MTSVYEVASCLCASRRRDWTALGLLLRRCLARPPCHERRRWKVCGGGRWVSMDPLGARLTTSSQARDRGPPGHIPCNAESALCYERSSRRSFTSKGVREKRLMTLRIPLTFLSLFRACLLFSLRARFHVYVSHQTIHRHTTMCGRRSNVLSFFSRDNRARFSHKRIDSLWFSHETLGHTNCMSHNCYAYRTSSTSEYGS